MPRSLTAYRVFIASPGGLETERSAFRDVLTKFSDEHSPFTDVIFEPVGWEDALGGAGRPQEIVNHALDESDYAVFVLYDRWGSHTGGGYSSGTQEEWHVAEGRYKAQKLRNICLFFKNVDADRLRDPGPQLQKVIEFRQQIESEKKYLFKTFNDISEFQHVLRANLARWLHLHSQQPEIISEFLTVAGDQTSPERESLRLHESSEFNQWISEARKLMANAGDFEIAHFFATNAVKCAKTELGWAEATNLIGISALNLGRPDEAITTFSAVVDKFEQSSDVDFRTWWAKGLVNKGIALRTVGRLADALTTYKEVAERIGNSNETPLNEQRARALINEGVVLADMGKHSPAIEAYERLISLGSRIGNDYIKELVAKAYVNKGISLGEVGRKTEELLAYDGVVEKFGASTSPNLQRQVARALVNKGMNLGDRGEFEEATSVYCDVVERFKKSGDPSTQEQVAKALNSKGVLAGTNGKETEAVDAFNDLIELYSDSQITALRSQVAWAHLNKAFAIGKLEGIDAELSGYDSVIECFGAPPSPLKEQVARAMLHKGITLADAKRLEEASSVFNQLVSVFGSTIDPKVQESVREASEKLLEVNSAGDSAPSSKSVESASTPVAKKEECITKGNKPEASPSGKRT
ncbi:tetratricopeptide repeat protein [Rhizobium grahamii]|uniref:tetratricopeptide repeat protein n=1 Tax=Rhizobium grahamii TaxID=1120045 RepID=UPI0011B0757D|nr:tetratricopeptide repeat protein [Rhizobium grahamii]